MTGRVIVITGASDGVGAAAAEQLAVRGDEVIVVGRDPAKTVSVANRIGARHFVADFSRLDEVRRLAEQLREALPRIDVLANNAGIMVPERRLSGDGFELTLQVNHLAPFLLTNLLLDRLESSRASVVATTSVAHRFARLDLQDLQLTRGWSAWRAYANSKLLNILFTRELHHRHVLDGVSTACFHPGVVGSSFGSDAQRLTGWWYRSRIGHRLMTSPAQAARTLVQLAEGRPPRDWASGEYYVSGQPERPSRAARDASLASSAWQISSRLLGIS